MESLARVGSVAGCGRIILLPRFRENRWAELAEIDTTRSLGCFLLLISFLARFVIFDLLSKAKYAKMVRLNLAIIVPGKPLSVIGRNYTTRSLGCFLELISFPARSVPFYLLSKVKYTKMVLVSCYRGFVKTAGRNWPKCIPRALWGVFCYLLVFWRVS